MRIRKKRGNRVAGEEGGEAKRRLTPAQRAGQVIFVTMFSLAVAGYAYQWITDTDRREQRALEERVVLAARDRLQSALGVTTASNSDSVTNSDAIDIVDPLQPVRAVGKSYVFQRDDVWEVSGYFRRDRDEDWQPYLVTLDADLQPLDVRWRHR